MSISEIFGSIELQLSIFYCYCSKLLMVIVFLIDLDKLSENRPINFGEIH